MCRIEVIKEELKYLKNKIHDIKQDTKILKSEENLNILQETKMEHFCKYTCIL